MHPSCQLTGKALPLTLTTTVSLRKRFTANGDRTGHPVATPVPDSEPVAVDTSAVADFGLRQATRTAVDLSISTTVA
jgi:hypothetical protein